MLTSITVAGTTIYVGDQVDIYVNSHEIPFYSEINIRSLKRCRHTYEDGSKCLKACQADCYIITLGGLDICLHDEVSKIVVKRRVSTINKITEI